MSLLVYGEVPEGILVFMEDDSAWELADLQKAISRSKTWGEFRQRVCDFRYEEVLKSHNADVETFEEFFASLKKSRPDLTEEEAEEEYWEQPLQRRVPRDDDPLTCDDIPGYMDGIWPEWPAQEMLAWFPADIAKEYGTRGDSFISGEMLMIPVENEAAVVEALENEGYECTRDDKTIMNASGYVSESDD